MVNLIWAQDKNGAIGFQNQLLWHLPEDLKYFKEKTLNSPVIMGRNTWNSLPFKPLPNRKNIILSKSLDNVPDGAFVYSSIQEVYSLYPRAWVIGGESVYKQFLPYAQELFITEVLVEAEQADTYAPSSHLINTFFDLKDVTEPQFSVKNGTGYIFKHYITK